MAKSIKELNPINEGGANITTDTLMEGVTGTADAAGILARKMTVGQLEAFIAREGETPAPVEALVAERVAAEKAEREAADTAEEERAKEREDAIEEDAAAALRAEAARAAAAEAALDALSSEVARAIAAEEALDNMKCLP
jgi:hypothetical protein